MAENDTSNAYFQTEITGRVTPDDRMEEVLFYSRHSTKDAKPRLIRESDIRTAIALVAVLALVTTLPRRYWEKCAHFFAAVAYRKQLRKQWAAFSKGIVSVLGELDDSALKGLFRATHNANYRRLFLLGAELTGRRWQPVIEFQGAEELRHALQAGNGAIIWCNQFTSQNLIGKRALHESGFGCYQVSVAEHGFSNSAFASRFLNPLTVHAENRYLKERVVFRRADTFQVTKRISRILKRNGVVLMTNNIYSGSSFAETLLGASGFLQAATTPANFAVRGGAALFAMSTIEVVPFERYRAVISPEIKFGTAAAAKSLESLARALLQMRDHLFAELERSPEQYMLWGRQNKSIVSETSERGVRHTGNTGMSKR